MLRLTTAIAALTSLCLFAGDVQAQSLGDRLRGMSSRAVDTLERSADRQMRRVIECAMGDNRCIDAARQRGDEVRIADPGPANPRRGETFRGVEFPMGAMSFADEVVSYRPGNPPPTEPHRGAHHALGIPNWQGGTDCRSQQNCSFVSLGSGGELVLRFTDNVLTGSGDAEIDLWVFEVGPDVEDMSVDVSTDGVVWQSLGAIGGGKSGVDLDAFGFGPSSAFSYVRLTDDPARGGRTGATVGADVDAVGAISSRARSSSDCTCP